VRDLLEAGEVAGLAATHVVRGAVLLKHVRRLGPELEEADDQPGEERRRVRVWARVRRAGAGRGEEERRKRRVRAKEEW
jgi:hypothetical protein